MGFVLSIIDRWIIGGLLAALSFVLWWIVLDIRTQSNLATIISNQNSMRLVDLERRILTLEGTYMELKGELRQNRAVTERR